MDGWANRTLGEVCEFERGLTYSKADEVSTSSNVVLRANNIDLESGNLDLSDLRYIKDEVAVPTTKKVRQNSLLICTASGSRSHLGKIAFVDQPIDAAFGGFMGQITTRSGVSPRFLFHLLMSPAFKKHLLGLTGGANINNLRLGDAAAFEFSLPPLNDQHRIVALLDAALKQISVATTGTQRNASNASDLLQTARETLFSRRDSSWAIQPIAAICENLDGRRRPVTKRDRVSGPVPYYGASGIVDYVQRELFDEDLLLVSEDGANLLARTYPIAFSITGPAWVNNHAHVLRFADKRTQKFVEHYLNSIDLDPYITGMAQPKLNQGALNRIPVPLPPVERQGEIVASLESLQLEAHGLVAAYDRKLAALAELKQSLLARAFSGDLTREPLAA